MSLLRTGLVIVVAIMLLPTDEAQQAKVSGNASSAAERAASFCERNTATCAAGAEIWATFVKKAEFGARLAGNMIQDYLKSGPARPGDVARQPIDPGHKPASAPAHAIEPGRGTLTPGDIAPAWRGGVTKTGT
jgi:hypothetical protein